MARSIQLLMSSVSSGELSDAHLSAVKVSHILTIALEARGISRADFE